MFDAIHRFLSGRSQAYIYTLGFLLVAMVGAIDFATGREVAFSYFYLLPILLVTWYGRRGAGYAASAISAFTWLAVDQASGHVYSHFLIPFWNAIVRLAFFVTTTYLLASLKSRFLVEQRLARVDDLTRLYSARAFKEFATNLIDLSKRHAHPLALAYIDLDDFKQVNDELGHSQGDAVLRMVGETLKNNVRSSDIVGRLGGDEFALMMPETGLAAAHAAFAKIHQELKLQGERAHWPIGFSIGVAVFTTPPSSLDEAIDIADRLMYRVKASGKNRVIIEECHSPDITVTRRAFES